MKKLLTLFIIPMATIASDSYPDIFEYFPEESIIRNQCIGFIEKNPKAMSKNYPLCLEIAEFLKEIKAHPSHIHWNKNLHNPVSLLLAKNSSTLNKDREHAYVEGVANHFVQHASEYKYLPWLLQMISKFETKTSQKIEAQKAAREFANKPYTAIGIAKRFEAEKAPIVHIPKGTKF